MENRPADSGVEALNVSAVFASSRAAGNGTDHIRWMKQGAVVGCAVEALPAAEAAEAEQGQRSVFCKGATTPEAKAGNRNPEPRPGFCKRYPWHAAKIG